MFQRFPLKSGCLARYINLLLRFGKYFSVLHEVLVNFLFFFRDKLTTELGIELGTDLETDLAFWSSIFTNCSFFKKFILFFINFNFPNSNPKPAVMYTSWILSCKRFFL